MLITDSAVSPNYRHGMTRDEWVTYQQQEAYKYENGDYPPICPLYWKTGFIDDAHNDGKWIDWIDEVSGSFTFPHRNTVFRQH